MSRFAGMIFFAILLASAGAWSAQADTGYDAWLRYAPLEQAAAQKYANLPATAVVLDDSPLAASAQEELIRGVRGMLGRTLREAKVQIPERAFVMGTLPDIRKLAPGLKAPTDLGDGGYWLTTASLHGFHCIVIAGNTDRGVLYGVFAFLSKMARDESLDALNEAQRPFIPLRWVNQWDNLDGSIERGYGGRSIFFENGAVRQDVSRVRDYGRLLASVGINGCIINNVNADPRFLQPDFIAQIARIADALRPWGVRMGLAVNLGSPKLIGGLDTFDPLDRRVEAWWKEKVDEIYREIPDFGGFVVKADSESIAGPSKYARSPAAAANMLASALAPHGGVLFYRAFVYNNHLDWRNLKNDRAKAAYDIFHPLDGKFDANVIIQIKNGPIDFQVREPVSPLLGGLKKTNEAVELDITQEYTGQQRQLCLLVPMWEEILDFDMQEQGPGTAVKDLIAGKTFDRPTGGIVGVANVGMDANWLGNPLAMANLYGFGRLAWDPNLSSGAIVDEWTRLTFGNDPLVVRTIAAMQLASRHIYESYTGPLGLGTLTDILGSHYGPDPQSAERNGWGQWLRADHDGIGVDRTIATGTGFIAQYASPVQEIYETLTRCPDNLLLFFHHVPYAYRLHSGKTVIQYVYDSHYEGAERAAEYVPQWESLAGRMDDSRYGEILAHFEYQAGAAIVWRDAICDWFHRMSGVADDKGRVGRHPDRIEAEAMHLDGYAVVDVHPWEAASGGKAIECPVPRESCTATFRFDRPAGWYDLDVQYFDQLFGESKFRVFVGDQQVDEWVADAHLPATEPNGATSTRRRITGLALHLGDEIRIEGFPDGGERAPLDYISIHPFAGMSGAAR